MFSTSDGVIMPTKFTRAGVVFFFFFSALALIGISRLILGDNATGAMLLNLAIFGGYVGLSFELIAVYGAWQARRSLPCVLR